MASGQPRVRPEPERASGVFEYRLNHLAGQAQAIFKIGQLSVFQPRRAVERTDPQSAFGVFGEGRDQQFRQPISIGEAVEAPVLVSAQSALPGSHPHLTRAVFKDRIDIVRGQSVFVGVGRNDPLAHADQSAAPGRNPELAFAVFNETRDVIAREAGVDEPAVFELTQSAGAADPEIPLAVFLDDRNDFFRQAVLFGVKSRRTVLQPDQSGLGSDPDGAGAVFAH
ncbi:MAG: hypothetical protein JMDDDDMK_00355 [Acidobacteria bacterium]|nr:hypothetical protein [Acidobacteriota bacterium]